MATSTTRVSFDGTQDSAAASWTPISPSFAIFDGITITDGSGAVAIWLTGVSNGAATVNTSARFSGSVDLTAIDK